jgi:Zn-dependent peptidase ImmA (M78 family)
MAESETPRWKRMRYIGLTRPDDILREFGIRVPPIDVWEIAERMGIKVLNVSQPGWAGAVRSNDNEAFIWVRAEDLETRKRFTVAHELGHLMLHPLGTEYRDNEGFTGGPGEGEANRFAAGLLMPMWMLDSFAMSLGADPRFLAGMFDVSVESMKIRLRAWENL